ncbi:DNA-directed DNA polymerase I [Candidatus Bathyarchaeota archaeon]|nr:MAG: DNA-directed DNA polymerase I [Candidatus Bathyarchaeota archaeon]
MSSLDQYMAKPEPLPPRPRQDPKAQLYFRPSIPQDLAESYFIGAGYDGERRAVYLKLYEPKSQKIHFWYDNTGHVPYCLSKEPVASLQKNHGIVKHPGFLRFEQSNRFDALEGKQIPVTIIYARDPLSIGGRPSGCIRDITRAWEADIRYTENYIYDRRLEPGMSYVIKRGNLTALQSGSSSINIQTIFGENDPSYQSVLDRWLRLLEFPVPEYRRVAFDIEVEQSKDTRVPDPTEAEDRVICASFSASDGLRKALLLRRQGFDAGSTESTSGILLEFYETEEELLSAIFRILDDYPVILTFNGDDFDLRYLSHRAQRLGYFRDTIPIELGRESAGVRYGIHLDLYKFFFNRSIQVYAFSGKYREVTLDAISEALLEEGKLEISTPVSRLSYSELAEYCFQDAQLVLRLSQFDGEVVMKLVTALSRISFLPIEDMSRQGVSGWIRSMMFREHRLRGYIIPRSEEITESKGATSTTAVIKGKKYKGGMVVDPIPGVHFQVAVLDFASLYPSIIKTWNLGYETILCNHPEDRTNKIPDTDHWVCRKKKAMESQLVGSLRDIRIKWYKPKSKETNLPPETLSWYQVVQNALKVVLNASYGVFGSDRFSLYCPPLAESTAAVGRYDITSTIKEAKRLGIEVFYGDTDSLFLGTPDRTKLDELIQWSRKELGMELEVDKNYRYVALSLRKKNYLGVHPDNRVDIKGLTGKKRHTPEFIKETFNQMIGILGQVQTPLDFDDARTKIKSLVQDSYSKLRNRKYSLDDLAFNMMIGKSVSGYTKTMPQHVKAAQQLRDKGDEIKAGDLVSFVKVSTSAGVKPVRLASLHEIDVDKYTEYIRATFEQVLDALGLDYEELTGAKKLESFFPGSG